MAGPTPAHPDASVAPPAGWAKVRRVLIVRPSALGDVARTVPCLATLKRALPGAQIDWLVNRPFADVIRAHPMLNAVVPFDRRPWWKSLGLMRRLRAARYDAVVDLQGLARSGLFSVATGAALRLGEAGAREGAALAYTRKHTLSATHTVDRMLELLDREGFTLDRDMRLHVPDQDAGWWAQTQPNALGEDEGGYIVLAPTAKWGSKCWPVAKFTELARRVRTDGLAARVVVLAGPGERARVQPLLDALGREAACPETTVGRMMAVIAGARAVVANDSAALHIAVGLGRPAVAVFGTTDPQRVGPYGRLDAVVQPPDLGREDLTRYRQHRDDDSLIARVPIDAVWDRLRAVLDPGTPRS